MSATVERISFKGIDPRVLEEFGVRQGFAGWRVPYFDSEGTEHRVKLFPEEGATLENGARSRWLGASKPQIPYGGWRLRSADKRAVILTEGESDTWALAEFLPSIVALGLPGASSWKTGWSAALSSFDAVYCSFDADDAGRSLTDSVMRDIPSARYVQLPEGADTRQFLQRAGRETYLQLLRGAEAVYRIRRAVKTGSEPCRLANVIRETWEAP